MKKRGLSLTELIVAIVISSIVMLAITVYFVSEYRFRSMMQDRIAITREARLAMNHMTRILRFADPGPLSTSIDTDKINTMIEGGHLAFMPELPLGMENSYVVKYERLGTNVLEYTQDPGEPDEIARYITEFIPIRTSDLIEIRLTAQKGNQSVSLKTKIRAFGEIYED